MFRILIILLLGWAVLAYEIMFAINCGSYTHSMINSKYFNYTVVLHTLIIGHILRGAGINNRDQSRAP